MGSITEKSQPTLEQKGISTGSEAQAAMVDSLAAVFEALGSTQTRFRLHDHPSAHQRGPSRGGSGRDKRDSPEKATRFLRRIGADISPDGHAIALGVSLTPTPHSYRIADRQLYTWCAPDAILFPIFFDQTANISSTDPIDDHRIRLTVSSERVEECLPASAVVSLLSPDTSEDVRAGSCAYGHLFISPAAAKQWTCRPAAEGNILTVEELHQIGRRLLRIDPLRRSIHQPIGGQ